MTSENPLFDTKNVSEDNKPDPNVDSYLETLVGEGKKFATPEELAKGKVESDRFIQQLQEETAGLRDELNKRLTIEDFMEKINSQKSQEPAPAPVATPTLDAEKPVDTAQQTPGMSQEDIRKLIENQIEQERSQSQAQQNVEFVRNELTKAWGNEYPLRLRDKAKELGVSEDYLQGLAAEQPKVFLATVNPAVPTQNPNSGLPPRTATESSLSAMGGTTKNNAYFQKLRKENPKEYWKPSVQNEIHRLAAEMGDSFFN
jgi:hypothetical protein